VKKLALVIALLALCTSLPIGALAVDSEMVKDAKITSEYLAAHTEYGHLTVADWKKLDAPSQVLVMCGISLGLNIADSMLCAEASDQTRIKRSCLLQGWKSAPADYASEIDKTIFEKTFEEINKQALNLRDEDKLI
jgi:hypothetical protein